jgi:hypothetical protein
MGCVIPHQSNAVNIPHQTNAGLRHFGMKIMKSYHIRMRLVKSLSIKVAFSADIYL